MDPQLRAQLKQTIYVATVTGRNAFGTPSYSAPVAVLSRVEDDLEESESPDGERRASRKRIVTETVVNMSDRVWLPGDDQTVASLGRSPMKTQPCIDERGNVDHCETVI